MKNKQSTVSKETASFKKKYGYVDQDWDAYNKLEPAKTFNRDFFVKAGKKGGSKTALKGKEYYQNIGKLGAETRWKKDNPSVK